MINSIQQFSTQGVENLSEIFKGYTTDLTKIAEMVYGVTKEVTTLGYMPSAASTSRPCSRKTTPSAISLFRPWLPT